MLKYFVYYKMALQENLAYKADIVIYIVINLVFFFIYLTLWKSIYTTGNVTQIDSYSLSNTVTYYFVTSIIFRFDPSNSMYLNYSIWEGSFANDLVKPWNAIVVDVVYTLSELTMNALFYIPFALFIMIVAFNYVSIPSMINGIYFLITIFLGIFLNIFFYQMFHALCLHFGDQEGNINLIGYLIVFPAGAFFPLAFLPEALKPIFYALPFRFLFDTPANIYLGKLTSMEIFSAWGQMILWTLLFATIFYFIYKSGLKKFTGTGR